MTNSPYRGSDFLKSGDVSINYEDLDYTNKLKIKALEGLDSLAASLNAISNLKAIEFQISNLNEMSTDFTEQMAAKDAQIAELTTQLQTLSENFNKFKSVLTSIDQMTDEAIG